METNNAFREYHLKKKTDDPRDFSRTKVFGLTSPDDLPQGDLFIADPLEIKNQDINYRSDFCAGYAASAVVEDHEGVVLVPEWSFGKAKQLKAEKLKAETEEAIQEVIQDFGLELRDIMLAGCKKGFLERQFDPFHCDTQERPERNFLADWRNWPEDLDMLAWEHAQASFFSVDGPYDHFDNIRAALKKHQAKACTIVTGIGWRRSWMDVSGGRITKKVYEDSKNERSSGHAYKIFGQIELDDSFGNKEIYLVAQLSNGTQDGDKGLYYFCREAINDGADYGAYMFNDMPKEKAEYYNELNIQPRDSFWKKVWKILIYWLNNLTKNYDPKTN